MSSCGLNTVSRDLAGPRALMTSLPDGQALYERITTQHPFTAFFETADVDVIARALLFPHEAWPLRTARALPLATGRHLS